MITVVSRSGMESEKPSRTVLAPKDLWTFWNSIIGGPADRRTGGPTGGRGFVRPDRLVRPDRRSQKHQRPEGVQHQDRLTTENDGAGRVAADALCPAPGG